MIIEWDPTTCRRAGEHGASKRVEPTRISLGEVFLIIIGSGLFVTVLKSPFARLDRSLDAEGQWKVCDDCSLNYQVTKQGSCG